MIFGLDSFAEGPDLPGDACVQVIIARLPFAMPDDPVDKTLARWIEKQGGNPFFRHHRARGIHQTYPGRWPPDPHRNQLRPRHHP